MPADPVRHATITRPGAQSFWNQACDLFETGSYELTVIAAQLHVQSQVRLASPTGQSSDRARLELRRQIARLPDQTRRQFIAHMRRYEGVINHGETVTRAAALDSLLTAEEFERGTPMPGAAPRSVPFSDDV